MFAIPISLSFYRLAFEGVAELQEAHPAASATWYGSLSCVVDGIASAPTNVDNAKAVLEEMIMQASFWRSGARPLLC